MDRKIIDRFAAGGPALRHAVQGLTPQDVTQHPGPGKWSILELVVHMQDSDAVAIDRMKRIIAEENPSLLSYAEENYIARLHPHDQSLEDAVAMFEIGRRQFTRVLLKLSDADMKRTGTHNVSGKVSVVEMLTMYTDHLDHHLKFLYGKREKLGKPLKV